MSRANEVLSAVRISAVWCALGGEEPRHGRARAFWRQHADGFSVSLNDARGIWFDFRDNIGGGILALVQHVRGGMRKDALRWLSEHFCLPLAEHEWTEAEKREWARRRQAAEKQARPLARLALWWLRTRMAELSDAKAEAISGDNIDIEALAYAARELHRLETLTAGDVLHEFVRFKAEHPEECDGLLMIGRTWENVCLAAVRPVLAKIAREQKEAVDAA